VGNSAVCLIAWYDFSVNRPSYYIINHQQLQWAAYLVLRVASTYHRSYYSTRLLTKLAHIESNQTHNFYFILLVYSGLGMCVWQIKLPVVTPAFGSYCKRVEYSLTYQSFASFSTLYVWTKIASIQSLILCRKVQKMWYIHILANWPDHP